LSKILIAAGASGGHVYPALATAGVLRERGHEIEFAGGDRLEARLVPEAGYPFHPLGAKRPPSVRVELLTPRGVASVASIGWATVRARALIRRLRPDVVLGMGGFAGVPVTLAGTHSRTPVVLHEQNAHLSFAQRIVLKRADALALGLPIEEGVTARRVELVGNPVRPAIRALMVDDDDARRLARTKLGLDPTATTLLVAGGSLGSGPLNETLPRLDIPGDVQVLHLAGTDRDEEVRRAWDATRTRSVVLGFLETMEDAYRAADVVVSRSGAATVSELAIAGLPSILVPLPTLARGDQEANARVLASKGGARIVMQSDPRFADALRHEIASVLSDPAVRASMRAGARSIARPDAAERLADVVESVVEAHRT